MNHMPPEIAAKSTLSVGGGRVLRRGWACVLGGGMAVALLSAALPAGAQTMPVSPNQRATASQVAGAGVPLSELAPHAPATHTVRQGDTLWGISGLFLRSPWRWPELWGMNMAGIRDPHRIYPGQVLTLDTSSGRAMLKIQSGGEQDLPTVRVSPRTRYESVSEAAIPPVSLQAIEHFLAEMLVVDETVFASAPRIVSTQEGRVLLSRGDRAYARGVEGSGVEGGLTMDPDQPRLFRVFRNATPLKDPTTAEVLGFEAQYVGKARLVRGEVLREVVGKDGRMEVDIEPATIDIVSAKSDIRTGDRLIPEPPRDFSRFVPRAPVDSLSGQVVSVYGSSVKYAAQNQIVALNRGREHGMDNGLVLAVYKDGVRMVDRTDAQRTPIRLPDERNGLLIVFRTFDRLSYALLLNLTDGVKVGDRFANP